ncbi:MAG: sugar transferase [Dorea sp.]|nr:sugar transferase [Dorea sp.]
MYERFLKRVIDIVFSAMGLIVFSWLFLILGILVFIDDPGPILFKQKRVGKGKSYFQLHKFRSMKMSAPHDMPTHMLENPEQYITRVGVFLRKSSLDELPQIWDIFVGKMSIIGPRPALWNQDNLVMERDRYGANDIKPGLTGWAQINGRDELEIPVKAKLDGEYVKKLKKGGIPAFLFDCRCFIGTIFSITKMEGVVEGGTGVLYKNKQYQSLNKTDVNEEYQHIDEE